MKHFQIPNSIKFESSFSREIHFQNPTKIEILHKKRKREGKEIRKKSAMTSGSNCGVHAASAITETDLDGRFWLGHAKQKEGKELECPGLSQEAENRDSGSLVHGRAEICSTN